MAKGGGAAAAQRRAAADAAYRAALGADQDKPLPKVLGAAASAGGARGGQGASRKGRGRRS